MVITQKIRDIASLGSFLSVLLVFSAILFTQPVHAQVERIDCGTPVCLEIKDSTFDDVSRKATVTLQAWNNHDSFVDDISYSVEFHQGESLPETGYLFSELEYVTSISGELEPLHPNEGMEFMVVLDVPQTVPAGNYFLRTKAANADRSIYGINFSREPLVMTGTGTYLPYIDAALIHPDTGFPHLLMEGPLLAPTSTPKLVLLQKNNPDLFEMLQEEEIFAAYKVSSLARPDSVVYEEENIPLGLQVRQDGRAIEIDIEPWENLQPGPYTAEFSFLNFRGEKVAEQLPVRLLYEGFFARMYDVTTSINDYKRGEPLDIQANIVSAGETDIRSLLLEATLVSKSGKEYTYNEVVPISGEFLGDDQWISFSNQKIKKTTVIEGISLQLVDQETGTVYDESYVAIDSDVLYGYPSSGVIGKAIAVVLIIIILILLAILYAKKKGSRTVVASMFACTLVAGSFLITNESFVNADATLGPDEIEVTFTDGPCAPQEDDPDTPEDESEPNSNDDSCPKPKLNGYLLKIWSTPSNEPSGALSDDCSDCEDVTYYVRMQCKSCGNSGLGLEVNFFNDFDFGPDFTYNLNTVVGSARMIDYGYYIIRNDLYEEKYLAQNQPVVDLKNGVLQQAPTADLAGTAVAANDVINWWIWGPFVNEVCYVKEDGETQTYNLQAKTQFAPGYCELAFARDEGTANYGFQSISGVLNDPRDIGPSCAELEVTPYIDDNKNGMWDSGESFLKSEDAPVSCLGTETGILGAITGYFSTDNQYTNLPPDSCDENSRPYFHEDNILPGSYLPTLMGGAASDGWEVTGIEEEVGGIRTLLYSGGVITESSVLNLLAGDERTALMGITNDGYPVSFSCGVDPEQISEVPTDVDYTIEGYESLVYDISEVNFVWSGETGTAGNQTVAGGSNNGQLSTSYTSGTGGVKNYSVEVYAATPGGTQVSSKKVCELEELVCGNGFVAVDGQCIPALVASCGAFDNPAGDGSPKLFFGPGEDVYWKATHSGGDDPYTYDWDNDASGTDQIVGPYSVGPGQDYVYSDVSSVYTAEVEVRDRQADLDDASCSISVKECNTTSDCPSDEICRLDTFTCGPPLPVIVEPLFLSPAVVNEGQQCNMSWEIEGAFTCELYKNGTRIDDDTATTTEAYLVDPGSYLLRCENEIGDTIDAGPARCLLNPQVRES